MPRTTRFAALICTALLTGAEPADDGTWHMGGYSFSDELGGFRILGVSGAGTRDDPVVVTQELYSASEMVLTIRVPGPRAPPTDTRRAGLALYLRLETVNASDFAWVEFGFELQQVLGEPSTYGDGLSFDQAVAEAETLASSAFNAFSRDFEPYDRVLFRQGKADPRETVTFTMLITDLTPVYQFHLVQDPRIPFS